MSEDDLWTPGPPPKDGEVYLVDTGPDDFDCMLVFWAIGNWEPTPECPDGGGWCIWGGDADAAEDEERFLAWRPVPVWPKRPEKYVPTEEERAELKAAVAQIEKEMTERFFKRRADH